MSRGARDRAATARRWDEAWPDALAAWGSHLRLAGPNLIGKVNRPSGIRSFAWFDLRAVRVSIALDLATNLGLAELPTEILAHEIGHHVLSPGDLGTAARVLARMQMGLVDRDDLAPVMANLWSDLLINDRLQRRAGLRMDEVWRRIGPPHRDDTVMRLVMRADELLWSLPTGSLAGPDVPGRPVEREAQLLARAVRAYADDPVGGAAGFGALVRQLVGDPEDMRLDAIRLLVCHQEQGGGAVPAGLATDPSLAAPAVHPSLDPRVLPGARAADDPEHAGTAATPTQAGVRTLDRPHGLEPAAYAALLGRLGLVSDPARAAASWYRENAGPHLVPFPSTLRPVHPDPLLGGLTDWDVGEDLGQIDWPGSLVRSPVPIPGVTLQQREHLTDVGIEPDREPVDLDLYLDSSGSIPDPRRTRSPLALAGAIMALSALRAGARVQATTWSGPDQVAGTDGFTENADEVLAAVVAYFGGSTAFPLERLVATHLDSTGEPRRRHIAVVSDSGINSMFLERGTPTPGAAQCLAAAGAGGSLILNVPVNTRGRYAEMAGDYDVYTVATWEDLVPFARAFAARVWDLDRTEHDR
ncbi:VWA domain-containing protein [Occultella glacieicola]|uniref:VWA domain-containing protein n=1 Tax=Occultella glacieicola TaxID=2518684 RepID=A0ABY2DYI6_9MICO|nr:VWA domain-containing protein [Occultella glacieicola]TDE88889.1 VWA domain-containing protein [Occultella glacieicola]